MAYLYEEYETVIVKQILLNCNVDITQLSSWNEIKNYIVKEHCRNVMLVSDVAISIAEHYGLIREK